MYFGRLLSNTPENKEAYLLHPLLEYVQAHEINTVEDLVKYFPDYFKTIEEAKKLEADLPLVLVEAKEIKTEEQKSPQLKKVMVD